MPTLDVSRVLCDPRFMTRDLLRKRTSITMGDNGRPQNAVTNTPFAGVVTTNSGLNMDRMQDGTLIKGAITIHTKQPLTAGDAGSRADEVIWRGTLYIVVQVLSNTHYGHGFVKAICQLKPLG